MFKVNSGRKQESGVWKHFDYDTSADKSKCKVQDCGVSIKGKNATNLMNHLKSKHKDIVKSLNVAVKENQQKDQGIQSVLKVCWIALLFCLW